MTAPEKSAVEILAEAKELIEKGWTRGENARDMFGNAVDVHAPDATCFCISGAIQRCDPGYGWATALSFIIRAIGNGDYVIVPTWNDASSRTQADVLAAFDRAIELAKSEAST